jgi:peptidoglycan/xylan/chitin deacetylase (PgdA/CDA1 family)
MAPDIVKSFAVIRAAGVTPVRLFRFPALCFNDAALRAIAPTGVVVIGGSASGDAFNNDRASIVRTVEQTARAGSILIFHITKDNAPVTADVVQPVSQYLRSHGYSLVKVSDLLAARQP